MTARTPAWWARWAAYLGVALAATAYQAFPGADLPPATDALTAALLAVLGCACLPGNAEPPERGLTPGYLRWRDSYVATGDPLDYARMVEEVT